MAKKGSNKKGHNLPQGSITLREESTGKRQSNVSAKSLLKLQHIKKLANWASCEASVPSLGAFFGHRLAECAEALGTPADPSLFTCQRYRPLSPSLSSSISAFFVVLVRDYC